VPHQSSQSISDALSSEFAEKAGAADEQPAIQRVAQREKRLLEAVPGVNAIAVRPQVREQLVSADPPERWPTRRVRRASTRGRRPDAGAVEEQAEAAEDRRRNHVLLVVEA
jgi:hypothetical protein